MTVSPSSWRTSNEQARDAAEAVVVDYDPLPAVVDLEDALDRRGARPRRDRHQPHLHVGAQGRRGRRERGVRQPRPTSSRSGSSNSVSSRWRWRPAPSLLSPSRSAAASPSTPPPRSPTSSRCSPRSPAGFPSTRSVWSLRSVGGGSGPSSTCTPRSSCASPSPSGSGLPSAGSRSAPRTRMATVQGRGQIQEIGLAADENGKLLAVRVNLTADMGAYLQIITPGIPLLGAFLYAGVYDLPKAYSFTCTGVFTDVDAHRRLPGRGPARGDLCHRAVHGPTRRDDGHRPGRDRAAGTSCHPRPFPYTAFSGPGLRLRQPRRRADQGVSRSSTTTAPGPNRSGVGRPVRRSTSASAFPPTSRCAASLRPGSWRR